MSRRRKQRQFHSTTAMLDLLFNTLLVFAAFFMLAFLLINPKDRQKKNTEAKADMLITVTWSNDSRDDVDMYVEDPIGKLVYFQRKEDGLMHLDRDDLGYDNDRIVTPMGVFEYKENREIVALRGVFPGEYVVNVHMYSKRTSGPTEVTIILEKVNPFLKLCASKTVVLINRGDEETAFRFTVNKEGEVTKVSNLKKIMAGPILGRNQNGSGMSSEEYNDEYGDEE